MSRSRIHALTLISVIAVGVGFHGGAAAGGDGVSIAGLLQQLQSPDEATRMAAVQGLSQAGPDAVAPLFSVMGGDNRTTDLAARMAVQRMVQQAAGPRGAAARPEISRVLAQQAAAASHPLAVRAFAITMLSLVGGDEVVPALAGLLKDPNMGEMARWTLVRIPGQASLNALAAALPGATGEMRIGVINALGARQDKAALPALEAAAKSEDAAVRAAAYTALARFADSRSEKILRAATEGGSGATPATAASAKPRPGAAWDAYVKLGERMLAAGKHADAEKIYRHVWAKGPDEQLRCAGIIGLGKIGTPTAVKTALDALVNLHLHDRDLRGAATEALVAAPGSAATLIIATRMHASKGAPKAALTQVLGQRHDPAAVKALAQAAGDKDGAVRIAAAQALGEAGDASAVPVLAKLLRKDDQALRDAAFLSLIHIRAKGVTQAEVAAAGSAPEAARAWLVRALGNRKDPLAMPVLVRALDDKSRQVRLAALDGLAASARLTDAAARGQLIAVLNSSDKDERQLAMQALAAVPTSMISADEKQRMAKAAATAPEARRAGPSAPLRAGLLRIMARWDDPSLEPLLLQSAADPNDDVAVAALDALTRLVGPSLQPAAASRIESELVRISRNSSAAVNAAAARCYLALADLRRQNDPAAALPMYHRALAMTTDDDARRIALRGIGAVGSVESLLLVEPLLEGGPVAPEAAAAIMPIADKIAQAGDKDKAIALYRKALRSSSDRGLLTTAVERLRALGVEVDIAADAGFATRWWVLGPFAGRKKMTDTDAIATNGPVNLSAPVVFEGQTYNWKAVRVSDPSGMLDLRQAVAPQDNCGAYAYAEVTSDAARDVIFKIGSDDSVICWLNGKRIHSFLDDRGYAPDQDIVPTRLEAGVNYILFKVLNGGADWACGLRITDTNNAPLRLPQRKG